MTLRNFEGSLADKDRFNAVRERAAKLGEWGINFSGPESPDSLVRYESALGVIEQNEETLDRNAKGYAICV